MKYPFILSIFFLILGFPALSSVITDPLTVQQHVQNGVLNADYIFEGEVIESRSFWNPNPVALAFSSNEISMGLINSTDQNRQILPANVPQSLDSNNPTAYWQRRIYLSLDAIDGATEVVTESSQVNWSAMNCSATQMIPLPKSNCVVPVGIEPRSIENNENNITLFPNPVVGNMQILFSTEKLSTVFFEIYSITGNLLFKSSSQKFGSGDNHMNWNAKNLKQGVYIGVLSVDGEASTFRLIKK
jgi:hypothetical protein